MKRENYIAAEKFCAGYNIEISFLEKLSENGLIHLGKSEGVLYIEEEQLSSIERILRLYFDLGINLEGIETILDLLERTRLLEEEIDLLRNRLRLYENI
ncbi:MAG TPA: chaperone modulator CbpM [Bacteroidales bacterium]|nr:chaperone modulator CbpM [Bacteroidales bacterium]